MDILKAGMEFLKAGIAKAGMGRTKGRNVLEAKFITIYKNEKKLKKVFIFPCN